MCVRSLHSKFPFKLEEELNSWREPRPIKTDVTYQRGGTHSSRHLQCSLEPRRSFSASSQVAYGSLLEEGRRNEQSECEQRSTECKYHLLSINRMIECCSDTKAERQKPKLGCAERTSGGFRSRGGASVTKSRVTDGAFARNGKQPPHWDGRASNWQG